MVMNRKPQELFFKKNSGLQKKGNANGGQPKFLRKKCQLSYVILHDSEESGGL